MNWRRKTDKAVMKEIGKRLKAYRIQARYKQKELAEKAGISVYTLQKLEGGAPTNMATFIQVLRALGALDRLPMLLPEVQLSPLDMISTGGKEVKRVR